MQVFFADAQPEKNDTHDVFDRRW